MELVLYYRGRLRTNGDAAEKQRIRESFHPQLLRLWQQPPLRSAHAEAINPTPPDPGAGAEGENMVRLRRMTAFPSLVRTRAGHNFVPLLCSTLRAVAAIDITMLRPERAGGIVTRGGDIDNRLKTLLDALTVPDENQARAASPSTSPFYVLLEDDNLIVNLSVSVDQLLAPVDDPSEVIAIIRVHPRCVEMTVQNTIIA